MVRYKPHYACFSCRKTFKRMLLWDINRDDKREREAKCPDCAGPVANMGKDFEAPKRADIKAWSHLQSLYAMGITFHSCGCSGPGYIPGDRDALVAHISGILAEYHKHLDFWRHRQEPSTRSEKDREQSLHWEELAKIPRALRPSKDQVSNDDAKQYWFGRIAEVEAKLALLRAPSRRRVQATVPVMTGGPKPIQP
ncbi:MAG: hypothetical protein IPO40_07175 [Fibrobacteres bacterium]|nr:hypothetical protein [Fibrobacterota bacterium]